jgi:hypothetical protein
MRLAPEQVERFYAIWLPLLLFVNRQLRVVPEMLDADVRGPWDPAKAVKIRDALWANDSVREAFIAQNPAGLSAEDLAIVASWQHRRAGAFYVLRHLKKHTLFLAEKGSTVYGVLGLASPLQDVVPFVPCYVKAVLLPFDSVIIYDSLIAPYNITFGPGIRGDLERRYKDARERGAIVTSLLPAEPPSRQEQQETIRSTNAKVLADFRTYLYRAGLSPKVVERDLAGATAFAEDYLLSQPEPGSLRNFGSADLQGYFRQLAAANTREGQRRQIRTGLMRLVRFLRDTDRLDYDAAESALEVLKEQG